MYAIVHKKKALFDRDNRVATAVFTRPQRITPTMRAMHVSRSEDTEAHIEGAHCAA